ncbi:hypothetical protein D3C87_1962550 [compost metagenome]
MNVLPMLNGKHHGALGELRCLLKTPPLDQDLQHLFHENLLIFNVHIQHADQKQITLW